jgi:hypothetical protein
MVSVGLGRSLSGASPPSLEVLTYESRLLLEAVSSATHSAAAPCRLVAFS